MISSATPLEKAETIGSGELFYRHTETGAQLHVYNMGHFEVNDALRQPLDINLIEGSEFRNALVDTYA